MAGINPISGVPNLPAAAGNATKAASTPGANFGDTLQNAIQNVDSQQQLSSQAVQDLLTGNTGDALPVISAVAKADLSFKLLLGVRNKVVEAYKQTMNMQV